MACGRSRPRGPRRCGAVAAIAAIVAGCGSAAPYAFVPERAAATIDGAPATSDRVPREAPRGRVSLAAFDILPPSAGAARHRLCVRMVVDHDGSGPAWRVDVRAQHLVVGGRVLAPEPAAGGPGTAPIIVVPPRERVVIDLYFALPGCDLTCPALRAFELVWELEAEHPVRGADRFERVDLGPDPESVVLASGPPWG